MKVCPNCNNTVEDSAIFCDKCGTRFAAQNNAQNGYYQQPSNNVNYTQQPYNYGVNQQPYQPIPQKQPKKKNTGLIIGIIAAVLIVLAIIGSVAEKAFQNQGYGNNNSNGNNGDYNFNINGNNSNIGDNNLNDDDNNSLEDNSSYDDSVKVEYTKGSFNGSVYTNEWADIKFALPEGFSNADANTYAAAESSTTECGAYFVSDDTMSLVYICFEKLPAFPIYDEEEYLDAVMQSLESITEVDYTTSKTYFTSTIAGYAYAKAECEFTNEYGDFANTIYVRKLDNYMIFISAAGVDSESNAALVNNITNVK